MSRIAQEGITVDIPTGWEGRIVGRSVVADIKSAIATAAASDGKKTAMVQIASFPLPAGVGDFGGGAVDLMGPTDLFITLFEYGPDSVGTPLFADQGIPKIKIDDPHPMTLRKLIDGQSGIQRFFTVNGRPFSLYVVFGSHIRRLRLVPTANDILATLQIS